MASGNELLLDVEVDPWGSTISIEDLDTDDRPGVPDGFKTDIRCWSTMHSIDVYTMSQDESEMAERPVRVRVYRGADTAGLGARVFDGGLELTTGILAVGAYLGTPPEEQQLLLGRGIVHLQTFTENAIETVHYDLPVSGAADINVLVLPT